MRWAIILPVLLAAVVPAARGDTYRFTINPASSTINSSVSASANFSGTLVGSYNAASNPGGTRTLLGAFGLCTAGNQAVPYTGHGTASGNPATHPTGTFDLALVTSGPAPSARLSNLAINLLGTDTPAIPTDTRMTWSGFRTCAPTGFFPSVPDFQVPLGDATVTALAATQSGRCSQGSLASGPPLLYTYSIPTVVTLAGTLTLGGAPVDILAPDIPATVSGVIDLSGATPSATLTVDLSLALNNPDPQPGPQDVPFDLPNPLGGTVHLLIDITVDSSNVLVDSSASTVAAGVPITPCAADYNNDAAVNSQDFFDFLTDFFASSLLADFNCDGLVNSQDFFDFLTAFFAGC